MGICAPGIVAYAAYGPSVTGGLQSQQLLHIRQPQAAAHSANTARIRVIMTSYPRGEKTRMRGPLALFIGVAGRPPLGKPRGRSV